MRYKFGDVFQENLDGSITPKVSVSINGIGMGPGVTFGGGVRNATDNRDPPTDGV